jgi:hypothetical protein
METVTTANGVQFFKSRLYSTTALTPQATQFGGGKSGIAMALGLIASIAIPFIAPMIASTLFAGTALATGALGAGIVGAGLGAAAGAGTAAIRGGNIAQGALLGGAVGGIGSGLMAGGGLFGAPVAGADAAAAAGNLGSYTGVAAPAAVDAATQVAAQGVAGVAAPMNLAGAVAPGAAVAAPTSALAGLTGSKFAQSALLAAPGLISAGMGGGQSTAMLEQARAELEQFRGQDSAMYEAKKKVYDEMLRGAQNIDPQFMQQQATTDVFRSLAQQQREREGAIASQGGASEDAYRMAEARRANVEGTAAAIGAGNRAFLGAQGARDVALRNASASAPRPSGAGLSYATQLAGMYGAQERAQAQGVGAALGGLSYPFLSPMMQQYSRPTTRTV